MFRHTTFLARTFQSIWRGLLLFFSNSRLIVTPWTATRQASLSFTISWNLFKLCIVLGVAKSRIWLNNFHTFAMSIEIGDVILPSHSLSPLFLLPSIFPSIWVFSSESALFTRWSKYWSFSISPSQEYSGLISFRTDWLDLLAVQGTLESSPAP